MAYREPDDQILGALLLLIGAVRVAIALARGESFGAEATIAAAMVVLGLVATG